MLVTRELPASFGVKALRTHSTTKGSPVDMARAHSQHQFYEETLVAAMRGDGSLRRICVATSARFPDGVFVEDAGVALGPSTLLLTNLGHSTRRGEVAELGTAMRLANVKCVSLLDFRDKDCAPDACTLDGGDVLRGSDEWIIGISERTTAEGIAAFERAVESLSSEECSVRTVLRLPLPRGLHLKSCVTRLKDRTLAVGDAQVFEMIRKTSKYVYRDLLVPDVEASNCVIVGQTLVAAAGYPESNAILRSYALEADLRYVEVDMSEFAKADGALTCCSIVFPSRAA